MELKYNIHATNNRNKILLLNLSQLVPLIYYFDFVGAQQ
jgi:hypothetical protein